MKDRITKIREWHKGKTKEFIRVLAGDDAGKKLEMSSRLSQQKERFTALFAAIDTGIDKLLTERHLAQFEEALKTAESCMADVPEESPTGETIENAITAIDGLFSVAVNCRMIDLKVSEDGGLEASAQLTSAFKTLVAEVSALAADATERIRGETEEVRKARTDSEKAATDAAEQAEEEMSSTKDKAIVAIQESQKQLQDLANTKSEELAAAAKKSSDQITERQEQFTQAADAAQKTIEGLQNNKNISDDVVNDIQGLAKEATKFKEETENSQNAAMVSANQADEHQKAVATALQQTQEHVAIITAKLGDVTKSQSVINEAKDNIEAFYAKVEAHVREMVAAKKGADKHYADLQQKTDNLLGEFTERTQTILSRNEELQKKVDDVLAGAVAGGLFKSFDVRQRKLVRRTRLWGVLLIGTLAVAVMVVLFVIGSHFFDGSTWGLFLVLRLTVAIPLGFAVYFCATQYNRERRLEEEYAFRSSISLSLQPYRKVLQEMSKEDNVNEFVKELMIRAFASPTEAVFRPSPHDDT